MSSSARSQMVLTGRVEARCGCAGQVMPAGTRTTGSCPVVTIQVDVPCLGGHPYRVGAGVKIHVDPSEVTSADTADVL